MKNKALTQVSLVIPPETEDAISVLFEQVFGVSPSIYVHADSGKTTATVYVEGCDSSGIKRLQDGIIKMRDGGLAVSSDKIKVSKLRREDWAESWKRHFKPIEIGAALLIKPSWSRRKPKKNQHVIVLDPGLSFGTGQHATTSFCLRQIVAHREKTGSPSLLDVGTGSGILAIAAAKLGYKVDGFDFDADAVRIAKENAVTNKVKINLSRKDLTKIPAKSAQRYDVVCANLTYDLLLQERSRILNRLKSDGFLILAGILKSQFQMVRDAYEEKGLRLVTSRTEKEWLSGEFARAK